MKPFFPLLLALAMASSCSFEKPLQFESIEYTQQDFEDCLTQNCPTIKVNYLQAVVDDKKSKIVNKQIQGKIISKIVGLEEAKIKVETIQEALQDFIADFKKYETDFGNAFVSFDIDTFMRVLYQTESFVSLELNYYLFTGGAHGYSGTTFFNFNAKTGQSLNEEMLFKDSKAVLAYAEKKFRDLYAISSERTINSSGFWFKNDQFHFPENIGFTETELIFHYNQYEIASYAEGPIILALPKAEIKELLNFL